MNHALRLIAAWLLLTVALAFSGCAPKAQLMVWRPAELNINGLERLAILDFEGEQQSGKIARSALQAQLFDNKYYTLVDQAELARVRPVIREDGTPDSAAAIEAARSTNRTETAMKAIEAKGTALITGASTGIGAIYADRLAKRGHDVGKIDGFLGAKTRAAVKKEQIRLGLPADSYPTAELVERLRRG